MSTNLPRSLVAGSGLAAACALALTAGHAVAAAPPDPATPTTTTLDTGRVLTLAGDGRGVAWLHADYGPNGGRPTAITLWSWDGEGPATRIDQPLPANPSDLALGSDRSGRSTIVLSAGGTRTSGPTTLYALPADGSAPPRKLAVSRPVGAESAPGLLDGVLSFSRVERARRGAKATATVRVGSLDSARSRLAWRGVAGTGVESSTPTASSGVAFISYRVTDAGESYALRLLRRGAKTPKTLSTTGFGGASSAGFGPLLVTAAGRRLTATRWVDDGGGHPADRTRYRIPSGARDGAPAKLEPGETDLGIPAAQGTVFVGPGTPGPPPQAGQLIYRPHG